MTIKELRTKTGMSQSKFAECFGIPIITLQNWEQGKRKCPQYLFDLMKYKLKKEKLIKATKDTP